MSIRTFFRNLWTPNPDKLILESRWLAQQISSASAADAAFNAAEKYALGIEGHTRWADWRSLVRSNQQCDDQLRCLNLCRKKIRQAKRLDNEDDRKRFLECFSSLVQKATQIEQLEDAIKYRKELWEKVDTKVQAVRPKVFVTHAFLMLEEISGIQIASLFVAGLMLLGAIFTWSFYDAAVGQTVEVYWTVDDLINQGIRVLLQVTITLIFIELVFFVWRGLFYRGRAAFTPHWIVVKHPWRLILPSLAVIFLVTHVWGDQLGKAKRAEFLAMNPEDTELATVMDGTILNDVYLVGTTSRTATFLQVGEWGVRSVVQGTGDGAGEEQAVTCASNPEETDNVFEDDGTQSGDESSESERLTTENCVLDSRVLIMDRALVVCHAKKPDCLEQERSEPSANGTMTKLDEVEERLGSLQTSIEQLPVTVDATLETHRTEIDTHLNRHLDLVAQRIDRLDQDWRQRVDGDDISGESSIDGGSQELGN